MRKILFSLLLILFAWNAGAATYYVDNTVADTNVNSATPDSTTYNPVTFTTGSGGASVFATAADVAKLNFSAGDVVYFRRGQTWAERLATNTTDNDAATITAFGTGDPPRFTGNGTDSGYVGGQNKTFSGLWFSGNRFYVENLRTGTIIQHCLFSDNYSNYASVVNAGGGLAIYNSDFTGVKFAVSAVGGTTVMSNNLFSGSVMRTAGTCSVSNSIFWGTTYDPWVNSTAAWHFKVITSCTDGGNNIGVIFDGSSNGFASDPVNPDFKLTTYQYSPVMFWSRDDNDNIGVFYDEMTNAEVVSRGIKGSVAVMGYNTIPLSAADITKLQTLYDAGHEIILHGGSHTNLGIASPFNAIAFSSTNTTPTITIDGSTTKTLTLASTENTTSVDWSADATKNICNLKVAAGCAGNCNTTAANLPTDPCTANGWTIDVQGVVTASLRLSSLADVTAQALPYTAVLDKDTATNRFYVDEIVASKTALESILGGSRTVTSLAYPGGSYDANLIAYIKASTTLKGARAIHDADPVTYGMYQKSINIYKVFSIAQTMIAPSNAATPDADIISNAKWITAWAKLNGGVAGIYVHGTNYVTAAQGVLFLTTAYDAGANMKTFSGYLDWLKADHSTADDITYTKTNFPFDLHLQSGSPAINAGINVGLTTDIEGKTVNSDHPEIGCYEYKPAGWKRP
jgi:hypothetical protein